MFFLAKKHAIEAIFIFVGILACLALWFQDLAQINKDVKAFIFFVILLCVICILYVLIDLMKPLK